MNALVPSAVLAAYAEPLVDGRRVMVFGDTSSDLGYTLVDRGARIVHVYDDDPTRAAQAAARNRSRNVVMAPFSDLDIAVRDGAFDVVFIENLAAAPDRGHLLRLARRALSGRGVVFVAAPNPDTHLRLLAQVPDRGAEPLGYYDLYDVVAEVFSEVRMLGQAPFAGYAVVDFSHDGELDVSLDTGFVPGGAEEPEWFVAVASERPVDLDAFTVVQLPLAAALARKAESAPDDGVRRQREQYEEALVAMRAELDSFRDALSRREAELAEARERAEAALARAEVAEGRASAADARMSAAESRAGAADARADQVVAEAEDRARAAEDRARAAEGRLTEELSRAQTSAEQAKSMEELQARQAAVLGELETAKKKLEHLAAESARLQTELAARDDRISKLTSTQEGEAPNDVAVFEAMLKERAERIRELEDGLREAQRVGHELVRELERARAVPPANGGRLAEENARLCADLEAARWTIDELEGRLERALGPEASGLEKELEKARTELQRQAALLAQTRAAAGEGVARPR